MGGSDWRLCVRASLDGVSKHGASAPALGAIACGKGNLGATAPGQRPITLRVHAGDALHFFSGCAGVRPWGAGLTCRFGRRRAFATGKLRPKPRSF